MASDLHQGQSRRRALRMGISATASGVLMGGALKLASSGSVEAEPAMTPSAAIKELIAGNRRFVSGHLTAHEQDLAILRQHTEEKQQPFAAVLSCADSRVPVELVFDQSIGRIFVTRVAGNLATPEIIGSLEFGAAVLGTKVILVLGHSKCGAVKATIEGKEVPGQISVLFRHIQPAVEEAGKDLEAATKANARLQAKLLREASPVLSGMVNGGTLKVVPAYYDLGSGAVALLE